MIAFDNIRHLLDLFRQSPDGKDFGHAKPLRQAAAAVFRGKGDHQELMLITSRDTGRWIVPKGWIEDGEDGSEAALREAWEEAGVTGEVMPEAAIGHYQYTKQRTRRGDRLCEVDVYRVNLGDQKDEWPEKDQRDRRWFPVAEAIGLVDETGLKQVIRSTAEPDRAA